MKLSSPIYHLKQRAKRLSREAGIPLHSALDRIANQQGFGSWSLLAGRVPAPVRARDLYMRLAPGELVLIGARPGHGKTLLSLEILIEAMKDGRRSVFFSLEYRKQDLIKRFRLLGVNDGQFDKQFVFDGSDAISARYIADTLQDTPAGTVIVIDYLQILDQSREKPALAVQIADLRSFARAHGITMLCISQISRSFDPGSHACPGPDDIRLPNPLDLSLFDTFFFLNNGEIRLQATA